MKILVLVVIMPQLQEALSIEDDLWVFGYGSLLWNQGFQFTNCQVGYVEGYLRRFWQGNTAQRGTPTRPGRVATLIQHSESRVWGLAFHLVGENQIRLGMEYLGIRECKLGGYGCELLDFVAKSDSDTENPCDSATKRFPVWTFIARPQNDFYLGPADIGEMSKQVIESKGTSGTSAEYILRLADYVKANIPEDHDEHLFELDRRIRQQLLIIDDLDHSLDEFIPKASQPTGQSTRDIPLRKAS